MVCILDTQLFKPLSLSICLGLCQREQNSAMMTILIAVVYITFSTTSTHLEF